MRKRKKKTNEGEDEGFVDAQEKFRTVFKLLCRWTVALNNCEGIMPRFDFLKNKFHQLEKKMIY